MSEQSAAAAAALGVPEAIVVRSAEARATETGMSVDEVLAAWAGGETAPVPAAPAPPTPSETAGDEAVADEAPAPVPSETPTPTPAAEPVGAPPATRAPAAMSTVSGRPPVLVGKADNPMTVFVGALALFAAVFLVGLVGPSLPIDDPGARSSALPFSQAALDGRHVFQSAGCASCHTQLVRPVVADVGLGAVSLNDSNQVLGTRRFGPDLSDVGTRLSGSQIEATITGLGDHPALAMSQDDLDVLVAYLAESRTSVAPPASAEPAEDEATETTEQGAES